MDAFAVLNLIGGLCLFLFGMSLMGQALERRAGNRLKSLLGKFTTNRFAGLATGVAVTAIIQSSSATTVMVVGFVNSGLMSLRQAINVIIGANVGTTATAWILSLTGVDSDNFFINLLKPSSFTPILALIGVVLYMTAKNSKRKDTGTILLSFTTLMFGMETMSSAVSGLQHVPEFQRLFLVFTNPILGLATGAVLTAVIQSSSASVGILQSLAVTGAVTYGAAIPIIMGQNIGTCVTALISSIETNKNAKRAALVHLSFNVIGALVWLTAFWIIKAVFAPALLSQSASLVGIAVFHTLFNCLCTLMILPLSGLLEKAVCKIIPDAKEPEKKQYLDERLLKSPTLALERSRQELDYMATLAIYALKTSLETVTEYSEEKAQAIRQAEEETDRLEDIISVYLVKLTSRQIAEDESVKATEYMKLVGDYERIADHAVNILIAAEEKNSKNIEFSAVALKEFNVMKKAVTEILDLSYQAFSQKDLQVAKKTEPLEQVIDALKEALRTRHIMRLQKGECSIDAGFIWSDLLTNLERVSDHCSNISGYFLDTIGRNMNIHENLRAFRNTDEYFKQEYRAFESKYFQLPSAKDVGL